MIFLILLILEILILYFFSRRVVKSVYRFFYRVTKRKNWTMYLFAVLFLPGTFIHEASHFLTALFLLVPVGKLEFFPKQKDEGGVNLGSVAIAKTDPLRRFLIGVGPLIFGLTIIFSTIYLVSTNQFIKEWWGNILAGIIIFQIANSMFSSKKDLEGAIILFVLLFIIIIILILLGVNIPNSLSGVTFSPKTLEIIKKANFFLLVPIVIDAVVFQLLERFDLDKINTQ